MQASCTTHLYTFPILEHFQAVRNGSYTIIACCDIIRYGESSIAMQNAYMDKGTFVDAQDGGSDPSQNVVLAHGVSTQTQ